MHEFCPIGGKTRAWRATVDSSARLSMYHLEPPRTTRVGTGQWRHSRILPRAGFLNTGGDPVELLFYDPCIRGERKEVKAFLQHTDAIFCVIQQVHINQRALEKADGSIGGPMVLQEGLEP